MFHNHVATDAFDTDISLESSSNRLGGQVGKFYPLVSGISQSIRYPVVQISHPVSMHILWVDLSTSDRVFQDIALTMQPLQWRSISI